MFGEKDYQQLKVVSRMARDLDLRLNVVGAPTVREGDGRAMTRAPIPAKLQLALDACRSVGQTITGEICFRWIAPAFKAERYGPGLLDATTRIINRIAEKRNVTIADVPVTRASQAPATLTSSSSKLSSVRPQTGHGSQ